MRILVVGGTVFIGRAIVRRLVAAGCETTVFHRGRRPHTVPGAAELLGDRTDPAALARALRDVRPDAVVDMCAMRAADGPEIVQAMDAAAYDGRWLLVSSADVYARFGELIGVEPPGAGGEKPLITEDSPLRVSRFPYRDRNMGKFGEEYDKIPIEEALLARAGTLVLRLPMIYGEGDPQRRIPNILDPLKRGEAPPLMTGPDWRTSIAYVENVALAAARLLEAWPADRVLHLVDEVIAERDLVAAVAAAAGLPVPELPPMAEAPAPDLALSSARIDAAVPGWREISTAEALARTVAAA